MKLNGTAFEESFTVVLRGKVVGDPYGWGSASHEKKWLENQLHKVVEEAVERFYQTTVQGTSIEVVLPKGGST